MAPGKPRKKGRPAASPVAPRQVPWGTIAAVAVVVVLAAVFIGYPLLQRSENSQWTPSEENRNPALAIPGIVSQEYPGSLHVLPSQQVAYTHSPPFGGAHDGAWAACNGVVYPQPVRTENLVHSLEHGAVWIAYDPDELDQAGQAALRDRVDGQPYTVMSPYPGLDSPISLQAWGNQLKLTDASDERIDQFIRSLRTNRFTHPEVGASCDALGPQGFDQDAPPPFAPIPPQGAVDRQRVLPENEGAGGAGPAPDAPPAPQSPGQ